jgi:hypothetical protein
MSTDLPSVPEWMDCEEPPPGSKVDMEPVEGPPIAPNWVTFEGTIENKSDDERDDGEKVLVRVSAPAAHEKTLAEYAESLHLVMEVGSDPPERAEHEAALERLAAEYPSESFEEAIARAEAADYPVIVIETVPLATAHSFQWAAKWVDLRAGAVDYWRGPYWVKMQVAIGRADLRGISGASNPVNGGAQSQWEVGAGKCRVHAIHWSRYRLNAAWYR